jgi:hypothetical protein
LLAIGNGLLLACLLLLAQLLACPSPPGLAVDPLSFSSRAFDLELQMDSIVFDDSFIYVCGAVKEL